MTIVDELYVNLTTFTPDGERRSTPVWIVGLGDGAAGLITASESWKMKRLKSDPRCELQASDGQGTPIDGSAVTEAHGYAANPEQLSRIRSAISAKYGSANNDWPEADSGIVLTLK